MTPHERELEEQNLRLLERVAELEGERDEAREEWRTTSVSLGDARDRVVVLENELARAREELDRRDRAIANHLRAARRAVQNR